MLVDLDVKFSFPNIFHELLPNRRALWMVVPTFQDISRQPTGIKFLVLLQEKQEKLLFKKTNVKKASKLTGRGHEHDVRFTGGFYIKNT